MMFWTPNLSFGRGEYELSVCPYLCVDIKLNLEFWSVPKLSNTYSISMKNRTFHFVKLKLPNLTVHLCRFTHPCYQLQLTGLRITSEPVYRLREGVEDAIVTRPNICKHTDNSKQAQEMHGLFSTFAALYLYSFIQSLSVISRHIARHCIV